MPDVVLITGCMGFIGGHLVEMVYDTTDWQILGLDALTYAGDLRNVREEIWTDRGRFEFWHGNVQNPALVDSLVARSTYVVHLAAETHVTRSIYDDREFLLTDVMGTHSVMSAVARHPSVNKVLHMSTSEVYGTAEYTPMDENHPLNPRSPYAAAKAGADRLAYSYSVTHGIPLVILRAFNQYGPRQHTEKAVPRFITNALLGEPLPVHGDGKSIRDFVFVKDTCGTVVRLLTESASGVYNLGYMVKTIGSVADDVVAALGGTVVHIEERPGQVREHVAKSVKIQPYVPRFTGWKDGLARTIEWYRRNPDWWIGQRHMQKVTLRLPNGTIIVH